MQTEAPTSLYSEGRDAWEGAGSSARNPYEPGTVEHDAWQYGYDYAREIEMAD